MKNDTIVLLLACSISASSCSTLDIETRKNPHANIYYYKKYAWAPEDTSVPGGARKDALSRTLQESVNEQLVSKGYTKTTPEESDFLVSYLASSTDKVYSRAPAYPPDAYYGYSNYYGAPVYYGSYREGQLVLVFQDSKTNEVIWEGVATDVISNAGAKPSQVAHAVEKLMKRFPS